MMISSSPASFPKLAVASFKPLISAMTTQSEDTLMTYIRIPVCQAFLARKAAVNSVMIYKTIFT